MLAAPDGFEPDDTSAEATSVPTNGTAQVHSIHDTGADVDWLTFTLTEPADLVIDVDTAAFVAFSVQLFSEGDLLNPIAGQEAFPRKLRVFDQPAGTYFVEIRAPFNSMDIDSYSAAVTATTPVAPTERINFVRLGGEGFQSLQFAPDGRLSQVLVYDDGSVVYRVRESDGMFHEELVTTRLDVADNFENFGQPALDHLFAQLLFTSDGVPHVLLINDTAIDHFTRSQDGQWMSQTSAQIPQSFFSPGHLAAAVGPSDSLHFVATFSEDFFAEEGSLFYGTNATGQWVVEEALSPAGMPFSYSFSANARRYLSLAVDATGKAHVAYMERRARR